MDTILTDQEKMVDFSETKEPNRIARRANNIAIKAYEFLKKMKVSNESVFSESKYWTHKRIRVGITDDINQRGHKDPLTRLRQIDPQDAPASMEPVVIAGVAFYLDHETKQAFPMKPQKQDDVLWPREKSPRTSMNIDK